MQCEFLNTEKLLLCDFYSDCWSYLFGCRGSPHREEHCHKCSGLEHYSPPPPWHGNCTVPLQTEKAAPLWHSDTVMLRVTETQEILPVSNNGGLKTAPGELSAEITLAGSFHFVMSRLLIPLLVKWIK